MEKIIIHNIKLQQLSLDMGKPEYDMLQGISAVENGFTNPAYDLSYDEYKEIKLFPMKSNEPTVKIILKNGGQIIGDFKNQKHIIRIPIE